MDLPKRNLQWTTDCEVQLATALKSKVLARIAANGWNMKQVGDMLGTTPEYASTLLHVPWTAGAAIRIAFHLGLVQKMSIKLAATEQWRETECARLNTLFEQERWIRCSTK